MAMLRKGRREVLFFEKKNLKLLPLAVCALNA
jgi:hypothetical protein